MKILSIVALSSTLAVIHALRCFYGMYHFPIWADEDIAVPADRMKDNIGGPGSVDGSCPEDHDYCWWTDDRDARQMTFTDEARMFVYSCGRNDDCFNREGCHFNSSLSAYGIDTSTTCCCKGDHCNDPSYKPSDFRKKYGEYNWREVVNEP